MSPHDRTESINVYEIKTVCVRGNMTPVFNHLYKSPV